jgi:hypothetical protein
MVKGDVSILSRQAMTVQCPLNVGKAHRLTSGRDLGEEIQAWTIDEDGVVCHQWQPPPDRGRSDPQVTDMRLVLERMAQAAARRPQAGVGPRGLVIHGEHPAAMDQPLQSLESLVAPSRYDCPVPGLGNRLLRDGLCDAQIHVRRRAGQVRSEA